jgi:hypothetical protein
MHNCENASGNKYACSRWCRLFSAGQIHQNGNLIIMRPVVVAHAALAGTVLVLIIMWRALFFSDYRWAQHYWLLGRCLPV